MESLESYLTTEGWKNDWQATKSHISSNYKSINDLVKDERGDVFVGVLAAMVATPICAYLGSYLGEGLGYLWGNLMDYIPLAKDVAPWLAERAGLVSDAKTAIDLNEKLYQTTGAVGGFWGGLFLPWKLLFAASR